jgi:hypothetical protein
MAVDPLLSEVDADVRAERLAQAWRTWRQPLAVFCVTLILATAAVQIWKRHQERVGGEALLKLTEAQSLLQKGKPAEAAKEFAEVAENTNGETRDIALLWQGHAESVAGHTEAAIAALMPVVEHGPGLWSDLACLRLVSLDQKQAACLEKSEGALGLQKLEWNAALLWSKGSHSEAIETLKMIAESTKTENGVRAAAQRWLQVIDPAAGKEKQ